jgi:hypothetical protein
MQSRTFRAIPYVSSREADSLVWNVRKGKFTGKRGGHRPSCLCEQKPVKATAHKRFKQKSSREPDHSPLKMVSVLETRGKSDRTTRTHSINECRQYKGKHPDFAQAERPVPTENGHHKRQKGSYEMNPFARVLQSVTAD